MYKNILYLNICLVVWTDKNVYLECSASNFGYNLDNVSQMHKCQLFVFNTFLLLKLWLLMCVQTRLSGRTACASVTET